MIDEGMDADPRTVTLEIRGPVGEVAAVRAWVVGRAHPGSVESGVLDQPDGTVLCRMSVVVAE